MRRIKYQKLDAFAAKGARGNPAAVLYMQTSQRLSEEEMLDIAREHRDFVSGVVFCVRRRDAIHLTFYSPEGEVDFSGHGAIACMYGMIRETPKLMSCRTIDIETNRRGRLTVYNEIAAQDAVMIAVPKPVYMGTNIETGTIADNLGIAPEKMRADLPVDLIDAGLRTLIVPIGGLLEEVSIHPGENRLKIFCETEGIDLVLIYSLEVADRRCFAHTRVFAPRFGQLEDLASGSGNGAFGHYMIKNRLWGGESCRIEQGPGHGGYNSVLLATAGEAGKADKADKADRDVLFGGAAALRIDGFYCLED